MPLRTSLLSSTMLSGIVGATFLSTIAVSAADLYTKTPYEKALADLTAPAVDGFTSKIDALGGVLSNRAIAGIRGSFSLPLSHSYAVQFDGSLGSYDGNLFGAIGSHWFWRDPGRGLMGLYVSHTFWDTFGGLHATHVAGEIEYYAGRWTVQGIAGVEFGNAQVAIIGPLIQGFDVKTRAFDMINVNYYWTDDMRVFAGHRYTGGRNALALGGELGFELAPKTMGTLFLEARVGERNFNGIWGGFRAYFGQRDKTLIQRNRQDDDPPNWTPDTLSTIRNTFTSTAAPSQCPPGYTYISGEGCVFQPS